MSGMLYSVKHYAERSDLVLLFRSLDEAREAMKLLVRHGFLDCDSFMEGFLRELGMPEFAGKPMPVTAATVREGDERFDANVHTSHFADCPNASEFRKNREAVTSNE